MTIVVPTPPSALPTPPSTTDPTNFDARADAFLGALPTMQTQTNQLAQDTYTNAQHAESQAVSASSFATTAGIYATNAEASATAAANAGNASFWVSGTTYTGAACVASPLTFQTYRRKSTGAGTIDPSQDDANWVQISSSGLPGFILMAQGII